MLQLILDFLGIDYTIVWTEELVSNVLPAVIVVCCVLALYMFICFFQFLYKLIKPKER